MSDSYYEAWLQEKEQRRVLQELYDRDRRQWAQERARLAALESRVAVGDGAAPVPAPAEPVPKKAAKTSAEKSAKASAPARPSRLRRFGRRLALVMALVLVGAAGGLGMLLAEYGGSAEAAWAALRRYGPQPARYVVAGTDGYGFMDRDGEVVVAPRFEAARPFRDGLAPVRVEGRWGYADADGRLVIHPRFDEAYPFYEGRALVVDGGRRRFLTPQGRWLAAPDFEAANHFAEGLAQVRVDGRYGYIDRQGREAIAPSFAQAYQFSGGFALIRLPEVEEGRDDVRAFIDRTGAVVLAGADLFGTDFIDAWRFEDGRAPVKLRRSDRWGVIDAEGTLVVQDDYRRIGPFRDERAPVWMDDAWGFIDPDGEVVIAPAYAETEGFSEGLAAVAVADRDGLRWGFIDRAGGWVLPPQYDAAESFENGLARVVQRDEVLYVDAEGRRVWSGRNL